MLKTPKGPLLLFSALWHCSKILDYFRKFFYCLQRVPLHFFSYFATNWSFKKPKGSPFYNFKNCAFWALDIVPTLAVPGLLFSHIVPIAKENDTTNIYMCMCYIFWKTKVAVFLLILSVILLFFLHIIVQESLLNLMFLFKKPRIRPTIGEQK